MELVIGRGTFARERGQFPPWRQVNMLLEEAPTDPKKYNLLSIPPLVSQYSWGTGPIHGIFYRPGFFAGAVFVVSNGTLYVDGVSKGAINGSGPVSWAAGTAEIVITRGQSAYSYKAAGLAAISFPDSANVRAVNFLSGRFFFARKDSGRFYWSDLNDGRTIDALNFATAESEPDDLLDIKRQGDILWMLGANTGEPWVFTGDPDLPVSRIVQRNLGCGVQDTGCAEEIEGTIVFISSDGMIRIIQEAGVRISDSGLEEKIRQSTTGSAFKFQYDGKAIFVIRIDAGTFGIDLSLDNQPVEFQTQGRTKWAPKCAVNVGSEPLFGDDTAGTVYIFDPTSETDAGNVEFPRIFSAGLPLNKPLSIVNVLADGDSGSTAATTGEAADPMLEMRFSRDGGREWSSWRATRWGAMGEYKRKARFAGCGMHGPPGFLAEFRMLACAPLRVANVRANESLAGRGR